MSISSHKNSHKNSSSQDFGKSNYEMPYDTDAERSLLGAILLNSEILFQVSDKLFPHHFYDEKHRMIYQAMVDLWGGGKPIDTLSLLDYLKSNSDQLENPQYASEIDKDTIVELISSSGLSGNYDYTADIIKEKSSLRELIKIGDGMKDSAIGQKGSAEDILDKVQKDIYEISLEHVKNDFVPIKRIINETVERINDLQENPNKFKGMPTGLTDLDGILGGFHNSDLIILAARPSMGKTSLALEIVKRIALDQKQGVAFFSLEMSSDQLVDKMISSSSGLSLRDIRSGTLKNQDEFNRLGDAISKLSEAPIWVEDSGSLNIMELRTKARRLKTRHNIGLVVIDYLQLMSGRSGNYNGNRVQEVSDISRGLKMLAKELNLPVLALSQLSRSVESREDKRPMLSDLRESGSIEQDADIVLFVHREEMYHKETKKKGIADIIVSKHRNGETGAVELAWIGHLATFGNLQNAKTNHRINK